MSSVLLHKSEKTHTILTVTVQIGKKLHLEKDAEVQITSYKKRSENRWSRGFPHGTQKRNPSKYSYRGRIPTRNKQRWGNSQSEKLPDHSDGNHDRGERRARPSDPIQKAPETRAFYPKSDPILEKAEGRTHQSDLPRSNDIGFIALAISSSRARLSSCMNLIISSFSALTLTSWLPFGSLPVLFRGTRLEQLTLGQERHRWQQTKC